MTGLDAQSMSQGVECHPREYIAKRADTFVACSLDGQATQALYHSGGHSESTLGFFKDQLFAWLIRE